jgi:ABC-type branched-subunit amino acid transport system ATPase component
MTLEQPIGVDGIPTVPVDESRPASADFMMMQGVSKCFHGRTVLSCVDFTLRAGEIAVLIGKSGSGKSTLLQLVVGSSEAGPISRVFLGSQAAKIVRHTPVPVLAIPRAAAKELAEE